jgi:hypothetical protein
MGNLGEAQTELVEAVSLIDQLDNFTTFVNVLFTQGFFLMAIGDFKGAVESYQRMLAMTNEETSPGHMAFILVNFSVILYAIGDLENARGTAQRGREHAEQSGAVINEVFAKLIIAACSLRLGQPEGTRALVLSSMKYALPANDALFILMGCGLLSWLALLEGDVLRGAQLLGAVLTPNADALGRQLLLDPLHKQYETVMPENALKDAMARWHAARHWVRKACLSRSWQGAVRC